MKALVLGATGFIGSHVVRALLEDEIDVRIVRRGTSPTRALEGLKVEEAIGDLNDKPSLIKAMRDCHVLFHAAGYYPVYSFDAGKQKQIALTQMKNVLEAAAEVGVPKIVYTSSMSTIGRSKNGSPSNEETPYNPKQMTGLYYEIKYLLEQEALQAEQNGLPVVVVNPTGVFGDYDVKPTSGILVVKIAKKEVPAIVDAKMNVVDAHAVGRGQIAAMKLGKIGRRYILGGHNTTVWKTASMIARLANVPPPKVKIPLLLARGGALASEVLGKYLLHQDRPFLPKVGIDFLRHGMHYDTTRSQKELHFKVPPLQETFECALTWFRKNNYI